MLIDSCNKNETKNPENGSAKVTCQGQYFLKKLPRMLNLDGSITVQINNHI